VSSSFIGGTCHLKISGFIAGGPLSIFPFISLSYPQKTKSIPNFYWCFKIHPLSFDFLF